MYTGKQVSAPTLNAFDISQSLQQLHDAIDPLLSRLLASDKAERDTFIGLIARDTDSYESRMCRNKLGLFRYLKQALSDTPYVHQEDIRQIVFGASTLDQVPRDCRGIESIIEEVNLCEMVETVVFDKIGELENLAALEHAFPTIITTRGFHRNLVLISTALTQRLALYQIAHAEAMSADQVRDFVQNAFYNGDDSLKYRYWDALRMSSLKKGEKELFASEILGQVEDLIATFQGDGRDSNAIAVELLQDDEHWQLVLNSLLDGAAVIYADVRRVIGNYGGAPSICEAVCNEVEQQQDKLRVGKLLTENAADQNGTSQVAAASAAWLKNFGKQQPAHLTGQAPIANMQSIAEVNTNHLQSGSAQDGNYGGLLPFATPGMGGQYDPAIMNDQQHNAFGEQIALADSSGEHGGAHARYEETVSQDQGLEREDNTTRATKKRKFNRAMQAPAQHETQDSHYHASMAGTALQSLGEASGSGLAQESQQSPESKTGLQPARRHIPVDWQNTRQESLTQIDRNKTAKPPRNRKPWSEAERKQLDYLVQSFYSGTAGWSAIKKEDDARGSILSERNAEDLRLKARNMKVDLVM